MSALFVVMGAGKRVNLGYQNGKVYTFDETRVKLIPWMGEGKISYLG